MITIVQQSTNNNFKNNVSFEAAEFRFARGQAQKFQTYVQENAVNKLSQIKPEKAGLIPQFLTQKGEFNIEKFKKQLRLIFREEGDNGTYIFTGLRRTKEGGIKAKLIHQGEDGKEIKQDEFLFNPTHLLKKTSPSSTYLDTMDLFNNMEAWKCGSKYQTKIRSQYKKDIWA